jgi:hypothetical protein
MRPSAKLVEDRGKKTAAVLLSGVLEITIMVRD